MISIRRRGWLTPPGGCRATGGGRMTTFSTSVRIRRPVETVYAFVADPLQFPRWNSAVHTVDLTSGERGRVGSRYSMQRRLPVGQVENELEVFSCEHATELRIRTTSGPTPFRYTYRFVADGVDTVIQLDAGVELWVSHRYWGRWQRRASDEASTRTSPPSSGPSRRAPHHDSAKERKRWRRRNRNWTSTAASWPSRNGA